MAQTRSVLCVPLVDLGEVMGLLYLENNQAAGAFSPARVELLTTLSTQMALSVVNARHHEDLLALNRAAERFVPHDFLVHLGRERLADVTLGDSTSRVMSVLFADVRDFTAHVEGLGPARSIEFVNAFLGRVEAQIRDHGGFVDSFLGDGIMALFAGTPDSALAAGVAMVRATRELAAERAALGGAAFACGIGVNTGPVVLGTIGAPAHLKCGVVGDDVNLAARTESLTRHYGVTLLTTDHTVERLERPGDFALRLVDVVQVKGRRAPVTLFEVYDGDLAPVRALKLEHAPLWTEAGAAYRAREFARARALFDRYREALDGDGPARVLSERCDRYAADPPSAAWAGVEALTHK
jgi:class 3 adenylate cyclase